MNNTKNISILDIISQKGFVKRYIILTLGLLIAAINYNLFILPLNIVTGGSGGVALICYKLFGIEPALLIFFISLFIFIICILFLGIEDTMAMGYITIFYPLFIKVTFGINNIFIIEHNSILLLAIFSGLINGISTGLMFKTGLNTGGFSVISKLIANIKKCSVIKVNFVLNLFIVLVGGFVFEFTMVLYAIIFLYISKTISDKILLGISRNKTIYIISKRYMELKEFLSEELHHDITIFNTKGKFLNEKQKAIMVVIPTSEYVVVKQGIKEIDNNSFVIVSDSYEVSGQDVNIRSVNYKKNNWFTRMFRKKMV